MKWFKHFTDFRLDTGIADFLDECELEGYGFLSLLMETVAERMDKSHESAGPYSLRMWSRLLYCHHNRFNKYLGKLQERGVVTVKSSQGKLEVTIPKLLSSLDDYTRKSGLGRDRLRTEDEDEDEDLDVEGEPKESGLEPPVAEQSATAVLTFPCRGKQKFWSLSEAKLAEYRETYPGLDVLAEFRKALQWLRTNPSRKKAATTMPAFLTRWLNRACDRGGGNGRQRAAVDLSAQPDAPLWCEERSKPC